jgi:protein-S-isoprenylcysteine O-methyltransferase Ste14
MMGVENSKSIESILRLVCGIAGLGTLVYAIANMVLAQSRPTGRTTGAAKNVLRTLYLIIASVIFIIIGILLWRPLPIQMPAMLELVLAVVGTVLFMTNLALYIWGLRSLGINFNASSGFGVRLLDTHELVMRGPYQYIRHPMYLGVILVGWGGVLLYFTWSMLIFAFMMLGLIFRAHREEQALGQEFGQSWEVYKQEVPGWIPHFRSRYQNTI